MIKKKLIIILLFILILLLFIDYNRNVVNISLNNKIKSGYIKDYAYIYDKSIKDTDITTIWIPGGGLSSFTFAFSGIGPFILKNNILFKNEYSLNTHQLFIDVNGLGFSTGNYATDDNELVNSYIDCINYFNLKKVILVGVSYGGKIAALISKKLIKEDIISVIGITPFYNAFNSMAYIPKPFIRLNKYVLSKENEKIYLKYKKEFKKALKNSDYINSRKFMDYNGKFAQLSKKIIKENNLLNILGFNKDNDINMWNCSKINVDTLGNWEIPDILKKINTFLKSKSKYNFLKPLYFNKRSGFNLFKNNSKYMMNFDAWNKLAWTNNSYMKGVNINNLNCPLITISGEYDVICSFDGHLDLFNINKNINKNHYLYNVSKGSHLLVLNKGPIVKNIIENLI